MSASDGSSGWVRRAPLIIGGAALAVFAALIAFGARGVRGSDQYWYMADLVMAKSGRGMVSNYVTPILWATDTSYSAENLPPPVHHVPVTYLAASINEVIDNPYLAWVVCNGILAVAAAWLVYLVARHIVQPATAAVAGALFLLSPQTVWFTLNPLMEQSLVLAAAVLALGAVWLFTRPLAGVVVMAVAVAFMTVSRTSNVLLIPSGMVLLGVLAWRKWMSWWLLAVFGAISTLLWLIAGAILPQYPIFSVRSMLALHTAVDARRLGADLVFYTPDVDPTPALVLSKAARGLQEAMVPASAMELMLETATLLLVLTGVVWGARSRGGKALAWWAVSLVLVYLATSALMQAQSRYAAPVLPMAVVLVAAVFERFRARSWIPAAVQRSVLVVGVVAVLTACVVTTFQYAGLVEQDTAKLAESKSALAASGDGSLMLVGGPLKADADIAIGYALAPSVIALALGTDQQTCVPVEEIERWSITRLAAPADWTDEQVEGSFCGTPGSPDMSLASADEGIPSMGLRLLKVQKASGSR